MTLNLRKNPTVYDKIDVFIEAMNNKLKNKKNRVSVNFIKFEDTRAEVFINDIFMGKIVSYYEDIKIPDDILLYFHPEFAFFRYIDMAEIDFFIKHSNELLNCYHQEAQSLSPFKVKNIFDYNWDHSRQLKQLFSGHFNLKSKKYFECSRITFSLIKVGDNVKLVDDFRMFVGDPASPLPSSVPQHLTPIKPYSISFSKFDNLYSFKHADKDPVYVVDFENHADVPNLSTFVTIVKNYSCMRQHHIELPAFEDFLNNLDDYKKIIQMSII